MKQENPRKLKINEFWSEYIKARYRKGWTIWDIVRDLCETREFFRDHGISYKKDTLLVNEDLVKGVLGI